MKVRQASSKRENFLISIDPSVDSDGILADCVETSSKYFFLSAGWNYSKDCPKEPRIPMYLVIGGTFGTMLMMLLIYSQIQSRRPEMPPVPSNRPQISFMKLIIIVLSCFLLGWFVMGESWKKKFSSYNTPLVYIRTFIWTL